MLSIRVVTVCLIFHEICCVDSAIISPPPNHLGNIINKDERTKNSTIIEIPIDNHAEIVAISPGNALGNGNISPQSSRPTPTKIPISSSHHKKVLTSIVHPLPLRMHNIMPQESAHPTPLDHKKAHDEILKHEVPKLQKMLHHHYTVEELRQRRKELKEKWQARHNKVGHANPRGLHNKDLESIAKISKSKQMSHPETMRKHIAEMYEQITPRTRRILEHKEDESKEKDMAPLIHSLKPKPRKQTETISQPIKMDAESVHPGAHLASTQSNTAQSSMTPEVTTQSEFQEIKHSTESHFKPNNWDFRPFMPDPKIEQHEFYWPTSPINYFGDLFSGTTAAAPKVGASIMHDLASSQSNTAQSSMVPEVTTPSEFQEIKHPAESHFKPNNWDFRPFMPDAKLEQHEFYWPSSPINYFGDLFSGTTAASPKVGASVLLDHKSFESEDSNEPAMRKGQGDIGPFGYGPSADSVFSSYNFYIPPVRTTPKSALEQRKIKEATTSDYKMTIGLLPSRSPFEMARAVAERTTTEAPSLDDVVSVKIDSSKVEVNPFTIRIDTPPYYRNMTYEEKFLYQKPLFNYGKSAEQVGDSIDIHPGLEKEQVTIKIDTPPYYRNLTHEEKILIQRPLWGLGKSAEEGEEIIVENAHVENKEDSVKTDRTPSHHNSLTDQEKKSICACGKTEGSKQGSDNVDCCSSKGDLHGTAKHGKRSSEHTTTHPEGNAMKIDEDPHVYPDWKEHLRRAVRERLQKLTNSEEKR